MITYVIGDLFESPAQVLVNAVNTVGVMGKGIAKEFKSIYPAMFQQYQLYCEQDLFDVGKLWLYKTPHKWILNFPTKKHWRNPSKLEYIESGLIKFAETYDIKGITSISFPKLGCGNGELDWETQVQPLMEKYLSSLPIDIYIHLYEQQSDNPFAPEHRNATAIRQWLSSEPQSLGFVEFWHDFIKIISTQQTHKFIQNKKLEFGTEYKLDEELIVLKKDNKMIIDFLKEDFVSLWQYIRSIGYVMGEDFPEGFDTYSNYIISLLAQLDYIQPVKLSNSPFGIKTIGIQLIEPRRELPRQMTMLERA